MSPLPTDAELNAAIRKAFGAKKSRAPIIPHARRCSTCEHRPTIGRDHPQYSFHVKLEREATLRAIKKAMKTKPTSRETGN